jgi:enamine deaminase RidA (YjgF/YER057c/UK114 family)
MRETIKIETGLEAALDSVTLVVSGDHIFTSGIAPDRPGSLESQARQVFQRIAGLLHDARSSLDDVVRTRAFFVDPNGESAVRAVHGGVFGDRGPAFTAIRMSCLPRGVSIVVEVEAIRGAGKLATRHGRHAKWGASLAVKAGPEIYVSGVTAEWPGVAGDRPRISAGRAGSATGKPGGAAPSDRTHEQQVTAVCRAVADACLALGASTADVTATRHFDPVAVHRHSFQGPALEEFRTPGEPTSAGITVEGVGGTSTFMLEVDAFEGGAGRRRNLRTGRAFEVEHHYSRSVRVDDTVYVAGSTSLVVGETVRHPHEVYGQVIDTLETIRGTIEAQGLAWPDLVRTRSYIVGGPEKLEEAIRALRSVTGGMGAVATVTGVPVLGRPEVVVEIEATALKSA